LKSFSLDRLKTVTPRPNPRASRATAPRVAAHGPRPLVNPRIAPAAVGLAVLVWQILSMPGATLPADPWAPRAEAEILLREGRWGLTPAEAALWPGLIETPGQYFFHNPATGRFYSKYGVLNTALALPPVALARWVYPGGVPARPLLLILNLYNALATALLAAVLFALARRVATDGLAALWTAAGPVFGFPVVLHPGAIGGGLARLVFTVGVWAFVRARETWARRPSAPVRWVALASASAGGARASAVYLHRVGPLVGRVLVSSVPRPRPRAALRPRWPSL
jgi:hypothetical protein